MNNELWQKVLDFEFDDSGDYTFTIRLAKENCWTHYFTRQALSEYKKFMYLAATTGSMVSPSEIVDIVWHQHLIFTQSYTAFCNLLEKQIQHIPSTHNSLDFEKFRIAKEHTTKQYNAVFGEQPKAIWHNHTMLQSLKLPQSSKSIQSLFIYAILTTAALLMPAYMLLRPIYVHISSPVFIISIAITALTVFFSLKHYFNNRYLQRLINDAEKDSFIHSLHPFEVIYLKTGNINAVINGSLGELMYEDVAEIDQEGAFSIPEKRQVNEPYMRQAMHKLDEYNRISHAGILEELQQKPIFGNIEHSMEVVNNHVLGSEKFRKLLLINMVLFAIPLLFIYVRIFTGLMRHKPVDFIVMIGLFFTIATVMHFKLMLQNPLGNVIAGYYLNHVLSKEQIRRDLQWSYVAEGPALLNAALLTIAYPRYDPNTGSAGDGGSGGCSSGGSCGSGGCGGGCGGCGGGD
ncbi:glycine-rich domain-containing protein [Flavobacterium psychrotrophum]|uniref:glycine-rich domain-containing protein n=1 Tax=Flavobacterium psychrotrophum TaxID=2294119 RepID=UPI0013C45B40|nr:hypothetical protein [Flavobacterium psychrotrophum]